MTQNDNNIRFGNSHPDGSGKPRFEMIEMAWEFDAEFNRPPFSWWSLKNGCLLRAFPNHQPLIRAHWPFESSWPMISHKTNHFALHQAPIFAGETFMFPIFPNDVSHFLQISHPRPSFPCNHRPRRCGGHSPGLRHGAQAAYFQHGRGLHPGADASGTESLQQGAWTGMMQGSWWDVRWVWWNMRWKFLTINWTLLDWLVAYVCW